MNNEITTFAVISLWFAVSQNITFILLMRNLVEQWMLKKMLLYRLENGTEKQLCGSFFDMLWNCFQNSEKARCERDEGLVQLSDKENYEIMWFKYFSYQWGLSTCQIIYTEQASKSE